MSDQENLAKFLVEEKQRQFGDQNRVLDELRRSRKARGGVGAPLDVPRHLKNPLIIADADIPRKK